MSDLLLTLLPGSMYFWVLFIGQTPPQEMWREAETQVLPRLLSCPVTPGQYVAAKLLRCFLLCGVAISLLLGCGAWIFHLHWGSPVRLAVVVITWAASMAGLLAMIYGVARTREQAQVLAPIVLLLLALLGGGMFPYENLPGFLQFLGRHTPNRWAVLALQGVTRARPWSELMPPLTALWLLGLGGGGLGIYLFHRRLGAGRRT